MSSSMKSVLSGSSSNTPRRNRTRWERRAEQSKSQGDRFIPCRSSKSSEFFSYPKNEKENPSESRSFDSCLADTLVPNHNTRVLKFTQKPPLSHSAPCDSLRSIYSKNKASANPKKAKRQRHISSTADRVLDAPDLLDDYYVNLLDWSSTNIVSIALGSSVYLWNASSGSIDCLVEKDEDINITSVEWIEQGTHLALGDQSNTTELYDIERSKCIRKFKGHTNRVSCLSFNGPLLASGSRDTTIRINDIRCKNSLIKTYTDHTQEVCGLKWSLDGTQLASGGNDNKCNIYSNTSESTPLYTLTSHTAAVKALAWSPHSRNLLATGGGTADRTIKFWNTQTGTCLNSIDTKSQVCSLVWNPFEKELLSAHGFSQNQLSLWRYPSLGQMTNLLGHTSRVLHMALSPDGTTVCSAAADETLRFWNVFEAPLKKENETNGLKGKLSGISIR